MRLSARVIICCLATLWLAACPAANPPQSASKIETAQPGSDHDARRETIFVTSNGWHTAIVLPGPALRIDGSGHMHLRQVEIEGNGQEGLLINNASLEALELAVVNNGLLDSEDPRSGVRAADQISRA